MKHDIRKLIERNCATYGGDGKCLLDRPCPYFNEANEGLPRCSWFENAVLPGDSNLHASYWNSFGQVTEGNAACQRCESMFTKRSNRQVYCDDCGPLIANEKKRQRDREYREKSRQGNDGLGA